MNLRWKIAQWFELQWWSRYLSAKKKEEYLIWKKNYWQNILSKVLEIIKIDPSKTICDLGCGPAGVFIALPENKITALDPLIDEYEKETAFFRKAEYPNTTFVQSTLEAFQTCQVSKTWQVSPHTPQKFDLVFCMNAINHVQNIEFGFDKLTEVSSEDGTLILTADAHNFAWLKYLFRLIPWDILHPHQYELKEYEWFLERRGWNILKTELLKKELFFNHYLWVARRKNLLF